MFVVVTIVNDAAQDAVLLLLHHTGGYVFTAPAGCSYVPLVQFMWLYGTAGWFVVH